MHLMVRSQNEAAVRLYRSAGFAPPERVTRSRALR